MKWIWADVEWLGRNIVQNGQALSNLTEYDSELVAIVLNNDGWQLCVIFYRLFREVV